MKHLVLFKFVPDYYNEDVFKETKEVFKKIEERVEDIEYVNVYSNCVVRDCNMDLMIEIKLKSKESLGAYLNDNLHRAFASKTDNFLISRVSFDYEE